MSAPSAARSMRRCGVAATASTEMRAPAACAAATIAGSSGTVPMAFDAARHRDPARARRQHRLDRARRAARASRGSGSAQRTVAPARSAAITHGRTFASWSRRVTTTSSPGASVRPTAAARRIVMRGHRRAEGDVARRRAEQPRRPPRAPLRRTRRSRARRRTRRRGWRRGRSASSRPSPSIATSTICVPAGPSSRAQPPARPGEAVAVHAARRGPHELRVARVGEQRRGVRDRRPSASRRPRRWA